MTDCIQQKTILEATWTDIPDDVRNEIGQIWDDYELGNDHYYWQFDVAECDEEWNEYPALNNYLTSRGITECLLHYWW